jgi:prophage antirepressor-like protein|nr:MAG TPA: BRO family protein [Caudoviricetes sp.]
MGSELQIIKSSQFGDIQCDVYANDKDMFMTISQLSDCLGYSDRRSIEKMIERNSYLKDKEFSVTDKLSATDGKRYNTRIFTEDGIYEITMLAKTEKAKEFRAWIRKLLKSLRKGETKLVGMTEYQKLMTQTRAENAKIRKAQILTKLADQYNGTYKQILQSYATKELTGEHILPLPELPEKTYSATDIANILGTNKQRIGKLSEANGMKTEVYGKWFKDKVPNHNKEVPSFRYYENAIEIFKLLLEQAKTA